MAKYIEGSDQIKHPINKVFVTYLQNLPQLVEFLPNIDAIERISYTPREDGTIDVVHRWKASDRDVPKIARAFIKPHMLTWHDHATWDPARGLCTWRTELMFLNDAIEVKGANRFIDQGGCTGFEASAEISVDATRIPGVPRPFAGQVKRAMEPFVLKLIEPNMFAVNRGVEAFLDRESAALSSHAPGG